MVLLFVVITLTLSAVSIYIFYPRLACCTRNFLPSPDDVPEFRTENLWTIKLFPNTASTSSLLGIYHSGCPSMLLFVSYISAWTDFPLMRNSLIGHGMQLIISRTNWSCMGKMLIVAFFISLALPGALCDQFEEELLIKDFDNGFSGLHFNFVVRKPVSDGGRT